MAACARTKDILQFGCALSYGLVEYLRTLDMLLDYGWSWRTVVPHGGHQISLNMAAGHGLGGNEVPPGIFKPFGSFAGQHPGRRWLYVALPDGARNRLQAEERPLYSVMR